MACTRVHVHQYMYLKPNAKPSAHLQRHLKTTQHGQTNGNQVEPVNNHAMNTLFQNYYSKTHL